MSLANKEQLEEQVTKLQNELDQLRSIVGTTHNKNTTWEPKGGEFFVRSDGVSSCGQTADATRTFGMERDSEKMATLAKDKMRVFHRLLAYRDEFDPEYVPKFDGTATTYFVHFNYHNNKWDYSVNAPRLKDPTSVFMSRPTIIELVRKLNSGEVVL